MSFHIRQAGFSMLELILVIVLLSIMASGAGLLIARPIEAYNDQLQRQQLVDQAEMALRQIARDIRRALPSSIRMTGNSAIEMVSTIDGARYRDQVSISPAFQSEEQSPGQRLLGTDGPISYVCNTGTKRMTRYDSYDYKSTQHTEASFTALPSGDVDQGLVVSTLSACTFAYDAGTTRRGGVVSIRITLTDEGESVSLQHQVPVVSAL